MGVCSAAGAAIAGKPAPTGKFFIIQGVAIRIMKVSVKHPLFSPVYERAMAFPLPALIENSSTAHRGHGPLVHSPQGTETTGVHPHRFTLFSHRVDARITGGSANCRPFSCNRVSRCQFFAKHHLPIFPFCCAPGWRSFS